MERVYRAVGTEFLYNTDRSPLQSVNMVILLLLRTYYLKVCILRLICILSSFYVTG
jgi:hypothetical protein